MNTQPNSDKPNWLEITDGAKPNVPALFTFIQANNVQLRVYPDIGVSFSRVSQS